MNTGRDRRGDKALHHDANSLFELDREFIASNTQQQTLKYFVEYFSCEVRFTTYYGCESTLEALTYQIPDQNDMEIALDDLDSHNVLFVSDSAKDVGTILNIGIEPVPDRKLPKADLDLILSRLTNFRPTTSSPKASDYAGYHCIPLGRRTVVASYRRTVAIDLISSVNPVYGSASTLVICQ